MEMFALDDEVAQLEALLPALKAEPRLDALVTLAWHVRQRDSRRAQALADEAKALMHQCDLTEHQQQTIDARLLLIEGEAKWLFAELQAAKRLAEQALTAFESINDSIGCADAHWLLAWIAVDRGQHARCDTELDAVILRGRRGKDSMRGAIAEATLARWAVMRDLHSAEVRWGQLFDPALTDLPPALACWRHDFIAGAAIQRSDFGAAATHYMRCRTAALKSGQLRAAIIASTNIGECFFKLNDHQAALDWMQSGLAQARPTGWPRSIGACLMHTSEIMRRMRRLDAARELLDEALVALAPFSAARSFAITLQYQGEIALDQHNYQLALDSFFRLEERADALSQSDLQMDSRRGQAHALSYLAQPEQALTAALGALTLAQQRNDAYRQIAALKVLADIHARHNLRPPPDLAAPSAPLHYLQQALDVAATIDGYTIPGDLLDAVGCEYAKVGDHVAAYQIALQANTARDQTHGAVATSRVVAMQVQQQTERTEAEREHLRQLASSEAKRAEVLQQVSETLRHLSAIGQEITANLDAAAVYQALNRHVHGLLDATSFSIFLLNADGQVLSRAFGIEAGRTLAPISIALSNIHSNAARCVRERREIIYDPAPEKNNPSQVPGTMRTLSALFSPLIIADRVLGVMTVQAQRGNAYAERENLIFRTLCAYGAIGLDNAGAYRQLSATLETLSQAQAQLALASQIQTQLIEEKMVAEQMARHKAEEATRLKSDFLANMSHEIRTPMNAIIGMAHLALRTELNTKQKDYVGKIHRSGLSLLGILNDILDFSKIEAGKLDVEKIPFFLDEVLTNVASVTCQKAGDKGLEYLFNVPHQIPRYLVGDPLRLGQVLINLINNAIKFTENGEIELSCTPLSGDPGNAALRFTVRDTGIGMTPEQEANLFQPFNQADSSITRKYGGTGLGLSISRHLVQLMGGEIGVQSQAGRGTSFSFNLTMALATAHVKVTALPPSLDAARILVVDDNPTARHILVEALRAQPLWVDACANGHAALLAIRAADAANDPYRIVLCDWQMPILDGIALTRQVQDEDSLRIKPAMILMTAFGQEKIQEDAEQAGASGFLLKPINQSSLFETLASIVAPDQRLAGAGPITPPQRRFHAARVLLAEDNDINQQIAVELLRVVGVHVDIANNGQEALDKLSIAGPQGYSLVLMDLEMPEMDGHAATLAIRRDARFQKLPIIAMTAHALQEIHTRCIDDGMQDFLSKPISPEHLYNTLARWLDTAPEEPQAEPGAVPAPHGGSNKTHTALPSLAGIDNTVGMSHVAGNRTLYLHLLNRFRNSQRQAAIELRQQCGSGKRQDATRRAHTLRGVAANVGAQELAHAAKVLERNLEDRSLGLNAPLLLRQLQNLDAELTAVLLGLDRYFTNHPPPPAGADVGSRSPPKLALAAAQAAKIQLLLLLQDADADALDYFEQHRNSLGHLLDAQQIEQLDRLMEDYAFDSAYKILTTSI
jgi:signal transduction histidine kinase/DNA-binding response OmpR family regulator/HPt (histidine-containing phosphotransfer) domain-containing protein